MQVPTLEQHQSLASIVSELQQKIADLQEKLNRTAENDKPWYSTKEVMAMYNIKAKNTIWRYQKIGLLTRQEVGGEKVFSREEVLNLPYAMKKYKSDQV